MRDLVRHGADITAENGLSICNSLSAACLGSGASVIDYLLYKGASPQVRDPLGHHAVHFAAANGVENLEALHQAERPMIMAQDKGKKSSLHCVGPSGLQN